MAPGSCFFTLPRDPEDLGSYIFTFQGILGILGPEGLFKCGIQGILDPEFLTLHEILMDLNFWLMHKFICRCTSLS